MHLLELVMDFVSIFTLKQDWNISQRTDCNRLVFDCSRLKPKKLRQLAIQHLSRLQLLLFQAYQKAHEVLKMDCRRRTLPKILARNEKEFSYSDIHISLCNRFSNNTNTAVFKSIFIKHIYIFQTKCNFWTNKIWFCTFGSKAPFLFRSFSNFGYL